MPAVFAIIYTGLLLLVYLLYTTRLLERFELLLPLFLREPISTGGAALVILCSLLIYTLILVTFWRYVDRKEPEPRWLLVTLLAAGIVVGIITAYGERLLFDYLARAVTTSRVLLAVDILLLAPVFEELAKAAVAAFVILKLWSCNHTGRGAIYGAMVGAGFGLLESVTKASDILFTFQLVSASTAAIIALEVFLKAMGHGAFTGLVGYFAARHKLLGSSKLNSGWLGLVLAIFLHSISNGLTMANHPFYSLMEDGLIVFVLLHVIALQRSRTVYPN